MSFAVQVDADVIGTASNALAPNRTFRLTVTDEWTLDEYLLQKHFDFKVVWRTRRPPSARWPQTATELWDTYGDPADFPHHP